jgi:hypothetical protein
VSDSSEAGEFVTIAEAARRLGISERQARRDAGRLPDSDRRDAGHAPDKAGHRTAAQVRLNALAPLRGQAMMPDKAGHHAGHTPDTRHDGRDELIEQLRGEVSRLNGALERAQTTLGQALGALANEQQRTRALEHEAGRLIAALPAPPSPMQTPPAGRAGDPTAGEAGESEHQGGPGDSGASEGEKAAAGHEPAARRGWLARLLLRGRGT